MFRPKLIRQQITSPIKPKLPPELFLEAFVVVGFVVGIVVSTLFTVIITVSVSVSSPSSTVNSKVKVVADDTCGAVNLPLLIVTVGPEICLQVMVSASPSRSVPEPFSVTVVPSSTVWSSPASATGA